ncbi:MAG: hypothetical protein NT005_02785 [Spirochaetes bacterium]|nr:hypothetical protein [Spirochaetota bacterium]
MEYGAVHTMRQDEQWLLVEVVHRCRKKRLRMLANGRSGKPAAPPDMNAVMSVRIDPARVAADRRRGLAA